MYRFPSSLCAFYPLLFPNWHADLEFACKFCFLVFSFCYLVYWRQAVSCVPYFNRAETVARPTPQPVTPVYHAEWVVYWRELVVLWALTVSCTVKHVYSGESVAWHPKLSGVDRSAQTRQVHINSQAYTCIHHRVQHAVGDMTMSGWKPTISLRYPPPMYTVESEN